MPKKTFTNEELQKLVIEAQEGSSEAFGTLYNHFFDQVYRYAAFRVPAEVAEDLVADIFVKAWEKLHTYKKKKNIPFSAWLFRIARHNVIDAYRTYKTYDEVPEDVLDQDDLNRAETRLQRNDMLRIVRTAMNKLPGRYREVLLLSYMGDLPNSEVARTLRITEGAVRILKFRALKRLEKGLPTEVREGVTAPLYST